VKYSPNDIGYNCIAYAAGDLWRIWDGYGDDPGTHWPAAPGGLLSHLIGAYAAVGFEECHDAMPEIGYEKVALYMLLRNGEERWTHAARLREDGWWESKLGRAADIIHKSPHSLEGRLYGTVARYMKRAITDRIKQRLLRWLMKKKKDQDKTKKGADEQQGSSLPRNKPIRIPLDFDKAIEGLLNVKPTKKAPAPPEPEQ